MNSPFQSRFCQWVLWICIVLSAVAMSSCYSSKKIQSYNDLPRPTCDFLENLHQEDKIAQMEIYRGYNFRYKSIANSNRCIKSSILPCGNISTMGLYLPNKFYAVMLQDSTKYIFSAKGEWKYMENANGIEGLPFFQQIPDSRTMADEVWARNKEILDSNKNKTLSMEDYKIIGIYKGVGYAIVFKCIVCVGAPTYYRFESGRLKSIYSFM